MEEEIKWYCDRLGIETYGDLREFENREGWRANTLLNCLIDYYNEVMEVKNV